MAEEKWWLVPAGALSAAALAYAVAVATFPDEQMYVATKRLHGEAYFDSNTGQLSSLDRPNWHAWITWPNTLDVHGEDLIDDENLKKNVEKNEGSTDAQRWVATLLLKGRDLTGADLSYADVRHVDLSGVILNRANLRYAWAMKAHFDHAELQGAWLDNAKLQGASLGEAQLQGASLDRAQLQGASLDHAQLQAASLDYARLHRAPRSTARSWRAPRSTTRSSRAPRSTARCSNTRSSRAPRSETCVFGEPTLETRFGRTQG